MSAVPVKADIQQCGLHVRYVAQSRHAQTLTNVRFSNRPLGVKRFQTIHQFSVDAARGLVLLFEIGTKALPSWDSKTRWNNLWGGFAVRLTAGPSGHTISPHPSSREGHHSHRSIGGTRVSSYPWHPCAGGWSRPRHQ